MPNLIHKSNEEGNTLSIVGLIKNLLIMYAVTMVILLAFAFLVTYTNMPDGLVSALVLIITIVSIITTGVFTGKSSSSKGWMHGATTGFLYMLILYLAGSLIFNTFSFGLNLVALLAMGAFSGAFGGIIGVNTKRKR